MESVRFVYPKFVLDDRAVIVSRNPITLVLLAATGVRFSVEFVGDPLAYFLCSERKGVLELSPTHQVSDMTFFNYEKLRALMFPVNTDSVK